MPVYPHTEVVEVIDGAFSRAGTFREICPRVSPLRGGLPDSILAENNLFLPVLTSSLGAGEVWDGEADIAGGSVAGGVWEYTRPKRAMTSEEIAEAIDARRSLIIGRAAARFREVIAAGKLINGVVVELSAAATIELERSKKFLPLGAVTRRGKPIDLPNEAAVDAVIAAIDGQFEAATRRERAIYDAATAASTHEALDLIDVETGVISVIVDGEPVPDGNGGWPSP